MEIHKKKFILLTSTNTEGKGVLVETLDKTRMTQLMRSSTRYRTHMKLSAYPLEESETRSQASHPAENQPEKHSHPRLAFKSVYMDEFLPDVDISPDTFVLLEHTYNIPFVKYPCEDHGSLDRSSLKNLRLHYIQFLAYVWNLTEEVKKLFSHERES